VKIKYEEQLGKMLVKSNNFLNFQIFSARFDLFIYWFFFWTWLVGVGTSLKEKKMKKTAVHGKIKLAVKIALGVKNHS